jgi:hypothetical protein
MITNLRSRLVRFAVVPAALSALAVPVALAATAGSAAASASCGTSVSDKDGRSWPLQTSGVSANQRSGSSTSCGITGYADNRDQLDYHCFTFATDGSTWTYLRNVHDGTYGRVKDSLLPDYGSSVQC